MNENCQRTSCLAGLLLCLATTLTSLPARAQVARADATAEEKAAARELALAGIELAQRGKCLEALDPLLRAEQLFHAPTILTWIGRCQIEMGRLVEGSETLRDVVREQLPADAPAPFWEAQKTAERLIAETAPRIGRLTIHVRTKTGEPKNSDALQVKIDGALLALALVGAPRPTDPGRHRIEVALDGYETASAEVNLTDGAEESLVITLSPQSTATTRRRMGASPEESSSSMAEKPSPVGWALVGSGAALLAGGGVFGYLAIDKKADLDCPSIDACPSSESSTLKSARLMAALSTVGFGIGGAALVGGIVVLLVTGGEKESVDLSLMREENGWSLEPQLGIGSLGLSGTF